MLKRWITMLSIFTLCLSYFAGCVMYVEMPGARGQLTEGGGWCVEVLTYLSWIIIFVTLPFSLCVCLKVIITPFDFHRAASTQAVLSTRSPSVRLTNASIVHDDETKVTSEKILIPSITYVRLVLPHEEWLVRDDPLFLKVWAKLTPFLRKGRVSIDFRS